MPNLCIIPSRALTDLREGRITASDLVVLCAIGHHTDGKTGEGCWASVASMCEASGVARRTFFDATKRLIEAGLVERVSGQLSGSTSTYGIVMGGVRPTAPRSAASRTRECAQPHTPTINAPFNAPINDAPASDEAVITVQRKSWIAEGGDWWIANVGVMAHPRFGKALKPLVDEHGWEKVFEAMKEYVAAGKRKGKVLKPEWFAGEAVVWLEWAGMPATDSNGDLTARGRAEIGL